MATAVEEFTDEIVGDLADDTSPEVLVLPSGIISSGKTTTVDGIVEYLDGARVGGEVSRHESDDFRWKMLEYGIVPESWEEDEYPDSATIEQAVKWTSESEEGSEYDIDWDAEVEQVVSRDKVYEMLGDWTLNSQGVTLYDGSNDRNHPLIRKAAQLDSDVLVSVQPVADDAWRRYIEDWGGDPEEFLEEAGDFLDSYGDMLNQDPGLDYMEELEEMAEDPQRCRRNREESLNPLMEDLSRIMNQPAKYLGEQYADVVDSLKQYSGRLEEFAENIQQQDETIEEVESLDRVELYYVADEDATSEEEARYGHREEPADGDPEDLGGVVEQRAT